MWYYRGDGLDKAEKLLRTWQRCIPRDEVDSGDALTVLDYLGMTVERNGKGHRQAFHSDLVGRLPFEYGSFTINCHAFGVQGKTHPRAIRDILRAAEILLGMPEDNDGN
jgi:hypothetical protein